MDNVYGDVIKWRSQWELLIKTVAIALRVAAVMAFFHAALGGNDPSAGEGTITFAAFACLPFIRYLNALDLRKPKNILRVYSGPALMIFYGLLAGSDLFGIAFTSGVLIMIEVYALAVILPLIQGLWRRRLNKKKANLSLLFAGVGVGLTLPLTMVLLLPNTWRLIDLALVGEGTYGLFGAIAVTLAILIGVIQEGRTLYDEQEKQP